VVKLEFLLISKTNHKKIMEMLIFNVGVLFSRVI